MVTDPSNSPDLNSIDRTCLPRVERCARPHEWTLRVENYAKTERSVLHNQLRELEIRWNGLPEKVVEEAADVSVPAGDDHNDSGPQSTIRAFIRAIRARSSSVTSSASMTISFGPGRTVVRSGEFIRLK